MAATSALFDRALMRRREAAAVARGGGHFLLDRVAGEMAERVAGMTRDFARALDLSPRAGVLAGGIARTGKAGAWTLAGAVAAGGEGEEEAVGVPAGGVRLVADEEWLPFAPASFDLVVSGLGLHRVNDLPGALLQINRALAPDGLFLGALFGGGTLGELRACFAEAEAELAGGASPRVMPFADVAGLGRLMQRAGFALPVADVERVTVRYETPFGLFADLRAMGETNALVERARAPLRRGLQMRAVEIYASRFADADGRVRASFDIVTLTGWHPDPAQPKPLRPGSAAARLADALGTRELGAGDAARPDKAPGGED